MCNILKKELHQISIFIACIIFYYVSLLDLFGVH